MKSRQQSTLWRTWNDRLLQLVGWGLGLPAGWWIVKSSYVLQHNLSETYFVVCYLLLYVTLALLAWLVRTADSQWPGFTLWTLIVFGAVGAGRLVSWLIHWERTATPHFTIETTLLCFVLGTASLTLFWRWELWQDRQSGRRAAGSAQATPVTTLVYSPGTPQREDVSWW